jgi:hypothetical protein
MKKLLFIIIPALLIALLIFLFTQYLNNARLQKGALQVTSSPRSKVYLNNKYIGQTPITKTEAQDMIQSGNYTIRLVPSDKSLSEYQEKITISTGILTVVDRKFMKGSLSEGYVISLSPLSDKKQTELEVISFPSGSKVELDANTIGDTPLLYKKPTESDHMLKITKNGYKEKAVRIRTPMGYRLTVIAYLGVASDTGDEPSPTIMPSKAPAASPSPNATKVLILDTPTGFLRVRANYSINAAIITTVSPGDAFPLIGEQSDWFEIKLPDGTTGWISSQYAKKQ